MCAHPLASEWCLARRAIAPAVFAVLLTALPAAAYQIPSFTQVTTEVGIDHPYSAPGVYGPGIAVVDIDDDGDLDVFIPNDLTGHKFYRNDGTGHFTDIAAEVGLQFIAELPENPEDRTYPFELDPTSMMPTFVDTDNDGDKDFFLTGYNAYCRFFENVSVVVDGELQIEFVDRTVESNLNLVGHCATAAWGDYNRDGWPDVYIADWGGTDRLFRNDRNNTWTDRSLQTRIHDPIVGNPTPAPGWCAIWWDHNRDGWPDLYVGNDYGLPNFMYMAATDGTFVDQKYTLFPELNEPGGSASYNATMGQALCDFDHDGDYDLFVANSLENNLYLNEGGIFTDQLAIRGNLADGMPLADLDDHNIGWFCDFPDVDMDGEEDLFMVNGYILICIYDDPLNPDCGGEGKQEQNNALWMNDGVGGFDRVTGVAGLRDMRWAKSGAFADFDLDGDLDLFVTNSAGVLEPGTHGYWRNDTVTDNNWLIVELVGLDTRREPFGAEVEVTVGDRTWRRLRTSSQGYLSYASPELHFGVGPNERVDSVVVKWPNGDVDTVNDVRTSRRMTIVQGEGLRLPALVAPTLRGVERSGGIRLSWDASALGGEVDRFILQRTAEGGIGGTIATIDVEPGRQTYEYLDSRVEAGRRYTYRLTVASGDLQVQGDAMSLIVNPMARRVELRPAAPNPFNPRTTLSWRVAPGSDVVRLRLFDTRGRLVREFDPPAGTGWNEITWDGTDENGSQVASGNYRFVVEADGQMESVPLTLVR